MSSLAVQTVPHGAGVSGPPMREDYTKRLPVEILAHIFDLVQASHEDNLEWIAITWVNKFWRETAIRYTRLWKSLDIAGGWLRHPNVLLSRSAPRTDLDVRVRLDMNQLTYARAWSPLQKILREGACFRLRKLTIRTAGDSRKALDQFLEHLVAPQLEALTLVHRNLEQPHSDTGTPLFTMLPKLPALKELRISGLPFGASRELLRGLKTLEVSNIGQNYSLLDDRTEIVGLDRLLWALLSFCIGLERLILNDAFIMSPFDNESDADDEDDDEVNQIELPCLRHLSIFADSGLPRAIYSQMEIPEDTAVTLRSILVGGDPNTALLEDVPPTLPALRHTAALVFTAAQDQVVHGWTNAHAEGPHAWSLGGDMRLQPRAQTRRKLLRTAFFDLPGLVSAARLVHLQLHIEPGLPTYAADWKALLRSVPAVRALHVGGERAACTMLAALPARQPSHERRGRRPESDGLPPRLHQLTLTLDALWEPVCKAIASRVCGVPVLRIYLPEDVADDERVRRAMRANRRTLRECMEERWGTKVRVEYAARCLECHGSRTSGGAAHAAVPPEDGEDASSDSAPEEVVVAPWVVDAATTAEWTPKSDPEDWSASSADTEFEWQLEVLEVSEAETRLSESFSEAGLGMEEYWLRWPTSMRGGPSPPLSEEDYASDDGSMTGESDKQIVAEAKALRLVPAPGSEVGDEPLDGGALYDVEDADSGEEADDEFEESDIEDDHW